LTFIGTAPKREFLAEFAGLAEGHGWDIKAQMRQTEWWSGGVVALNGEKSRAKHRTHGVVEWWSGDAEW